MPGWSAAARLLAAFGGGTVDGAIRAAVERLLAEAHVTAPPAPLELLGSLRGVERIEPVRMSSAGRLVPVSAGHYVAQVNKADTPGRQHFSTAHEICHTFFDEARRASRGHDDLTTGAFDERAGEEYLCDAGAAHMLLHPDWLGTLSRDHEPSLDRLFEIASTCGTSAEATARQLAALGVWRCSFVFWEPDQREKRDRFPRLPLPDLEPATPHLWVARAYTTAGLPSFPLRTPIDEGSSIAQALRSGGRTTGIERFDLGRRQLAARCESHYVGYTDGDGMEVPRVLTLMRWIQER